MKTKSWMLLLLATTMLLGGCATPKLMNDAESQAIPQPAAGKAAIVFMRTSFVAGAISAEIIDIENGELSLVGGLPMGKKIVHFTDPGEKVYMAYGTAADFMIANVEAGKTYYSIVRPNWGSGAFIPTPVRTDGSSDFNTGIEEFQKWVDETDLLVKRPDADAWFEQNRAKYQDRYERYWQKFETKTPAQIAERTLTPADGL